MLHARSWDGEKRAPGSPLTYSRSAAPDHLKPKPVICKFSCCGHLHSRLSFSAQAAYAVCSALFVNYGQVCREGLVFEEESIVVRSVPMHVVRDIL